MSIKLSHFPTPFSDLKNKTGKHKDWFGLEFFQIFCEQINANNKLFDNKKILSAYKKDYKKCELKERLNLLAELLNNHLDMSYKKKVKTFESVLGKPLPFEEGMFTHCFFLYPVSQFIENYGHQDLETSLKFIEKLTMRFTGEWAIRPLANQNPKKVLIQMKEWSKHKNFHVRRLSSEGLRARLPWGKKITWIDETPEKSLPIYTKLRNDKVLYVRRSVANSMGDVIKINDDLAYATFENWLSKRLTKNNLWVIKHAIRTPVKKGDKKYVALKNKVTKLEKGLS